MSYLRYLTSVNTSLREAVLPELGSGRARDALNNAISAIAAIAAQLDHIAPAALGAIDATSLPEALRGLIPEPDSETGLAAPLHLALSTPPDDVSVNHAALPLLKAGAAWLAAAPWPREPAALASAKALLGWESAMRGDVLARLAGAEQGFAPQTGPDGAGDIQPEALAGYLRARFSAPELEITSFRFLTGGRNRQTALFEVAHAAALPARLVIQREPAQQMTTLSGVGMQFAVIEALHAAGVKVARPVLAELSADVLGGPFMITEQVSGASPVPSMDYWSAPPKSARLARSLAAQFAKMHSVPITGLDKVMQRYVDPAQGQTWLGDLEALETQLNAALHAPSLAVTAALAWMRAHVDCADGVETIVHNDALLHNVLAENEEITALLDFEMAHIGHPFEDLGYVRPVVEQMLPWADFVAAYTAAGGRAPRQEQVDFFTLRSILKLLVQILYVRNAFDAGHANIPALAEIGASFVPKLIARLAGQLNAILRIPH